MNYLKTSSEVFLFKQITDFDNIIIMGIFNFNKEDDFPSTEEWEKMSHEEKIKHVTKSIIYVLRYLPRSYIWFGNRNKKNKNQ